LSRKQVIVTRILYDVILIPIIEYKYHLWNNGDF
jgi:hypothetical protein